MKYAFILANKSGHRVEVFCRVLGGSCQGYYAWRNRPRAPDLVRREFTAPAPDRV